ncbi:MAG: choice-of-anchor D domain-containing protein [Alphaproteobacteria bacterium]|nr:choice-of-anchor D domain-containing protein [Alphaproteobacteria bacterium]
MSPIQVRIAAVLVLWGCGADIITTTQRDQVDRKYGTIVVTPEAVVFGTVLPGEQPTGEIFVTNTGKQVLDVESIEVQGGGGAFTLLDVPRLPFEVEPGGRQGFRVAFQARRGDLSEGQVLIRADADNASEVRVPLNGIGGIQDILVEPASFAFGDHPVGCASVQRATVTNVGSAPLTVSRIDLAGEGQISLVSVPALPLELAPGASKQFSVFFEPSWVGQHAATLSIDSNDPEGLVTVEATASSSPERQVVDRFGVPGTFPVDVMLAVDRSCSMGDQGEDVGTAVGSLIDQLDAAGGDWHVGVLLGTGDDCFVDGWMDANTPDWRAQLQTRAAHVPGDIFVTQDGQSMLTEALLEATALATLLDVPGDCNQRFRRPGAVLQVILVSDERDQSSGFLSRPNTYWRNWVDQLRTYAVLPELLRIHGVVDEAAECGDDIDPASSGAEGYLEAVAETGGSLADVCDAPTEAIPDLLDGFTARVYHFPLSEAQPIPETITVDLDGVRLTSGWRYEPALNVVVLDDAPPPDAEIVLTYAVVGDCGA